MEDGNGRAKIKISRKKIEYWECSEHQDAYIYIYPFTVICKYYIHVVYYSFITDKQIDQIESLSLLQ